MSTTPASTSRPAVLAGAFVVAVGLLASACSGSSSPPTAGAAAGAPASSAGPSTGRPPNILYVLADDMRLDDLDHMPNTKRLLVDQGASFSNFFVNVSLCCPSRTSGLRGQYSHNTGVLTNGGSNGGFETAHELGVENETTATALQAAGYNTGLFGKYLNGYPHTVSDTYVPPGWTEWDSASKGNAYGEFNYTLNENGTLVSYGHQPEDYGTDVYMKKTSSFIEQANQQGKPFYAYVALYAPHTPSTPAPRHASLFADATAPRPPSFNEADVSDKPAYIRDRPLLSQAEQDAIDGAYRKRLQSLQSVDEGVALLYDQLKASGQLENTYIVFTSDNGFHLGERRMNQGKQTPYESDIRLPLVVRGPGIEAGSTVGAITGNVDLAPTFEAIGGAKVPSFTDGRSLLPLLSPTPPPADQWRQAYLLEHWREGTGPKRGGQTKQQRITGIGADGVQTEPPDPQDLEPASFGRDAEPATEDGTTDATDEEGDPAPTTTAGQPSDKSPRRSAAAGGAIPEFQGLRTARYLYVEYPATGETELYDLQADPHELDNKASSTDPSVLAALHAQLDRMRTCEAQSCREAEQQKAV